MTGEVNWNEMSGQQGDQRPCWYYLGGNMVGPDEDHPKYRGG